MAQVKDLKIIYRNVDDLIPYARNARTHSEDQITKLASSIKEFGFTDPIELDGENGILSGHGRVMAAKKLGLKQVPCVDLNGLTPAQKKAYILAANRLALDAGWDEDLLKVELEELQADGFDLGLTGFQPEELGDFLPDEESADGGTADEIPEPPEVAKTKPGDVWILGNHRLMCGDSTSADDIAHLLSDRGGHANLLFTDPPYGVSVVKDNKVGADFGIAKKGRYEPIVADDSTETAEKAFGLGRDVSDKQIVWGGNYFTRFLPFSDGWLVWDKRGDTGIRNTFADAEMAWCSFHTPVRIYRQLWNGMIREGEHDKRVHPTQKPVRVTAEIMKEFSTEGDVILDLFGGSGTVMIACESHGRICRMMELSPHYCDVIVERWQNLTGKQAVRESDGRLFDNI